MLTLVRSCLRDEVRVTQRTQGGQTPQHPRPPNLLEGERPVEEEQQSRRREEEEDLGAEDDGREGQ